MVRGIVVMGVMVAVVFSGGALGDVTSRGLVVTVKRSDGRPVTAELTRATEITCGRRRCDVSNVTAGAVVVATEVRRGADGARLFRRLELAARA
jgi:hypothetical protein